MVLNDPNMKLYTEDGQYICTIKELLDAYDEEIRKYLRSEEFRQTVRDTTTDKFHNYLDKYLR